jgi:hypothetical protein
VNNTSIFFFISAPFCRHKPSAVHVIRCIISFRDSNT